MDLLYPEEVTACHSDSELSNMDALDSSLKRHSHFFLSPASASDPARRRPRSVPFLPLHDEPASPMLTVLDDSSSERLDRFSLGTEGGGDIEDGVANDKGGLR